MVSKVVKCLCNAVLVWQKRVFVGKLENVDLASARFDDICGKIKILLLARQVVKAHHGLEDRGRIQPKPVLGCLVDVNFSFLFTYMRDDVVGGKADEGDNFSFESLIGADFKKIFKTENDVFAAPKIPGAEFGFFCK